jgi:protein TonB
MPDEGPAPAGANTLGPSAANNPAEQPAKSIEGGEAGAGELSERGDLPVVPGAGVGGGSGGPGRAGLGWGAEGSGVRAGGLRPGAGGEGPGGGVGSFARPLGGYQLLPRYPDSARRQGITGTTTLLFEVLANGRVGEVRVEQTAGHPDLDQAAAEAIKKWRFEPARRGNQAVAVWLRMPVKFVLR